VSFPQEPALNLSDLKLIKELQKKYLQGDSSLQKDYWNTKLLEIYAQSLGERILWKWEGFLTKIAQENILPWQIQEGGLHVHDWGCGPGTASLALLGQMPPSLHRQVFLELTDRSPTAVSFAQKRIKKEFPEIHLTTNESVSSKKKLLLISYVLSEITKENFLLEEIKNYDFFIWVDAGSLKESKRLSVIRDSLLSDFHFLSPCPHQKTCPLLSPEKPKDWCHQFAKAPREVFHSSTWALISKELKIDLRSLPYQGLYGMKRSLYTSRLSSDPLKDISVGRARVYKHHALVDFCTPSGEYSSREINAKNDKELFKKLKKES
jgi:hypothetical protein